MASEISHDSQLLARLKAKIVSAPELEQASLRVVISGAVVLYVAWYAARDGAAMGAEAHALIAVVAFFVFACVTAILLVWVPGSAKAGRILGIVVDIAVLTYAMIAFGEGGAVLISAYLFVTIGNGFRYGRTYLYLSQVLSILGFSFAMVETPFWSRNISVGLGFLVTLLIIPIYVADLVERIKQGHRRSEDALETKVAEAE